MFSIWNLLSLGLLQCLFLSTVTAQIFKNVPTSQIKNVQPVPYNQQQQLVSYMLNTYKTALPIVDKLGAIANVIQKMPANPRGVSQRQHMAEALKKSAIESLMVAANACKCNQRHEGMLPLPKQQMTVSGDVIGNRAVKVNYA